MNISPHFTMQEMTRTDLRNVSNDPGPLEVTRLKALCENILEPARAHFGPITVFSGYRCPEVNKRVGGAKASQHMLGEAADIKAQTDHFSLARWIVENLNFDQLIIEFVDDAGVAGWIHVSFTDYRACRRKITTATRSKMGTIYRNISAEQIPHAK